ncbi:MAG: TolC family outer membrane protein [Ectothiorhodospiraceae bacterium]|nr:TolC family outer membrane protein [Ectothiorhodospiraceae bacterium]
MIKRKAGSLRLLAVCALALAMAAPAAAQTSLSQLGPRDLAEIYRLAVDRDPQLRAAQDRRRAADELQPQARALFMPEINLEAQAGRNWERIEGGLGAIVPGPDEQELYYNQWTAGVNLTQPLFRMESFALRAQAGILMDQAGLQLAQAQQGLMLRVAEGYFNVLLAQDTVSTIDAEIAAIETELRRARRALDVGTGTITDVNDAQARYDLVQAQRLRAQNQLQIARESLRRLIGEPAGELAGLREDFIAQAPSPSDPEIWADRAERYNLEVRFSEQQLARSREEIRQERAGHAPRVDLVANYGRNYQSETQFSSQSQEGEQAAVGVRLQVPLFAGGSVSSRVREAQANRDATFQDTLDAKRQAGLPAESAYLNLVSSLQQIRALEQALRSIRSTEQSTQRGLEVGVRTTLDVLNVQRERFETERQLAEARYDYLLNYLALQVAVGGGVDDSSIEDVNYFLAGDRGPTEE